MVPLGLDGAGPADPLVTTMQLTRRELIRGAGATTLVASSGAAVTGSATASSVPEFDPVNVATADFPEEMLRDYQPAVIWSQEARDKIASIYAWRAKPSAEAETDLHALYYWFRYTSQRSWFKRRSIGLFSGSGPDSHPLDHEPLILFVDPGTGAVEQVVMTGYHHIATSRSSADLPLETYRLDDPSHVRVKVVDPWHHFNFDDSNTDASMPIPTTGIRDWLNSSDGRPGWYADGTLDATAQEAVDDPYTMRNRSMWWREGTRDAKWAKRGLKWSFFDLGTLPSPAHADDDLRI